MCSSDLLMSLGYGNFSTITQYDIFAQSQKYASENGNHWAATFDTSKYALNLTSFESTEILNSPNLSLFPLLAYHKICNDHYRNEKWQPFEPWTCNIDYLEPSSNMNAKSFIDDVSFTSLMTSILDLENSNLPIDYFTSVLPRAQYGDEAAVPIGLDKADATFKTLDTIDKSKGFMFSVGGFTSNDNIQRPNTPPVSFQGAYVSTPQAYASESKLVGIHGDLTVASSGLKL